MPLGKCPRCRDERVRYASEFSRHLYRAAMRSRKRYCPACGFKWSDGTVSFAREFIETNLFILIACGALIYVAVLVYTGAWKPLDDLKTLVRMPAKVGRRLRGR